MEQKKFDFNSIIGFALIFIIILWMMYNNRQDEVKNQAKAKTEKAAAAKAKGETTKEVAQTIPLKNLLIETDAPYLAPTPYRGKKNESSMLPLIAASIGTLRGLDAEDIAEWTTRNAKALFHVKP